MRYSNSVLICIFSYNVDKYVERVFNKLKKFKHSNKTILFINDFSTDNTGNKLKEIKKNNKKFNIKIINNKKNYGYGGNYSYVKFSLKINLIN